MIKLAPNQQKLTPLLTESSSQLSQEDEHDKREFLDLLERTRLDKKSNVTMTRNQTSHTAHSNTGYILKELNRIDNAQTEKTFK